MHVVPPLSLSVQLEEEEKKPPSPSCYFLFFGFYWRALVSGADMWRQGEEGGGSVKERDEERESE